MAFGLLKCFWVVCGGFSKRRVDKDVFGANYVGAGFGFFSTDRNVNFGGIIPEITAFNVQAGSHTSLFRAKICKYYWLRWVILIRVGFIIFTTDEE